MATLSSPTLSRPRRRHHVALPHLPGIALCLGVTGIAYLVEAAERRWTGGAWIEALVLAILVGTAIRTAWSPSQRWLPGIETSAKLLLEIAVVLLGASVSAVTVMAVGPGLLFGIAGVVALAILGSFAIGRALGLPHRIALLVACGNAICGNSAIAAVAPVIDADGDDVATSIAFTAVLGVAVVLGLPILGVALGMSAARYGQLAGLTVYAVPQVLAAAAAFGTAAVHMGTLVKLMRVLMLGPVCVVLAFAARRLPDAPQAAEGTRGRPRLRQLVPWFILGFLGLAALRSLGALPDALLPPVGHVATLLTVVSMAGLGLGVDVRSVARAGGRVIATVVLSLVLIGALSLGLIALAG